MEEEQSQFEEAILQRFQLLEFKGKGAYGVVWKAQDRVTGQLIALKKVFDAFHNQTDAQRTFREVIFLEQVAKHVNIVKLLQVIKARNNKDLYMVFEYMETDLHKVIRASILESVHKKYIIYQVLKALKFLHSGDIIHRDLKPANLLINAECIVKLADFGLARTIRDEEVPILTEYVATRWYRAPEILLGSQRYSKAVDMWSVGCILGELILGKAIFPGTSTMNQVELIIELLGSPSQDDIDAIQAPLANHILENFTHYKAKNFKTLFNLPDDALQFLKSLLVFNPNKRLTVDQALQHSYMKEFIGTETENIIDYEIKTFMNDNVKYSIQEYQKALYDHIDPKERTASAKKKPENESTNNSENKTKRQLQEEFIKAQLAKTSDKFKAIEAVIKNQKAKQIVTSKSPQYTSTKSVNHLRDNSKKKESSFQAKDQIISPYKKTIQLQQQVHSQNGSLYKELGSAGHIKQNKSSLIKPESTKYKPDSLTKKTYLQYILNAHKK